MVCTHLGKLYVRLFWVTKRIMWSGVTTVCMLSTHSFTQPTILREAEASEAAITDDWGCGVASVR